MQDINQMTELEKVHAMEQLWDSLTRGREIPESPEWHAEELQKRSVRINEGRSGYLSLDQLKERGVRK